MPAKQKQGPQQQHPNPRGWLRTALRSGAMVAGFQLLLMGPSRDWTWPASWCILAAVCSFVLLPCFLYIRAFNPDLVEERERFTRNKGTADFEIHLVPAVVVLIPLRLLAAGVQHHLQLQQPGWSATPFLSTHGQQAAAVALLLSCLLQTWAVCSNRYFSSVVRIQSDRGHKVCSSGPYAYVRHPGYVAFSLQGIAEAVLLESPWAMVFALIKLVLLVFRTVKENAYLKAHLPGYAAYAQRVKYSWVPLLW